MKKSVINRVNFSFLLATSFMLLIGIVSYWTLLHADEKMGQVAHTSHTLKVLAELLVTVDDLETGQRGYLITGQEEFLEPFNLAIPQVESRLSDLKLQLAKRTEQLEKIALLEDLISKRVRFSQQIVALKHAGRDEEAIALVKEGEGNTMTKIIRNLVKDMEIREDAQLDTANREAKRSATTAAATILFGSFIGCMIVFAASRILNRDLAKSRRAEEALSASEERFRIVSKATNDTIWDWDLSLNTIKWNEGIENVFGYTKEKVPLDISWWIESIFPDDRERIDASLHKILDHEGSHWSDEYRFKRQDGTYANVLDRGFVIRDEAGKPTRMIGSLLDISKAKALESDLIKAREAALEASRLKSEFLANMSHEIRTPMNGVIGMAGLLLNTELSEQQREFTETIRLSADSLLTVINDILDFSKIEAGKLEFDSIDFDLRLAVESCIELQAQSAQAKGLELIMFIEEHTPIFLRGDPGRLRQIITNLLGNAIKFTEKGEVVLRIRRDANAKNQASLLFEICDTGIGLAPETQSRLFQAFTQGDGSNVRRYGGTGLGLAISKQLVELMNGSIGVRSQLGQGSTFWFTASFDECPAFLAKPSLALANLHGMRAMVVDDNATNRKIVHNQIISWGMRNGNSPSNGSDALRFLRQAKVENDPYDLVILDMNMPEMDGLELAKAIKKDPSLAMTRLIMMSSLSQSLQSEALREAGIEASLVKPVKQSQLFDCIANVLAEPSYASPKVISNGKASLVAMAKPSRKIRILVAEDNIINQKIAILQLKKLGYEADAVANGLEVLEAIKSIPYELILLDCQMPEMDGFEATRQIRKSGDHRAKITIIALTANALAGDRERCLAAGMDDYISKPVKPEILSQTISRWFPEFAQDDVHQVRISIDKSALLTLDQLSDRPEENFTLSLIQTYLSELPAQLDRIKQAGMDAKWEALFHGVHALKSPSLNLGLLQMGEICLQLEKLARNDSPSREDVLIGINKLEIEVAHAVRELTAEAELRLKAIA